MKEDGFGSKQREYFKKADFKPARLQDLVGMPIVREELSQLIPLLKNYRKFWSMLPAGVLFSGEPGMGKTLASRILATETGAKLVDATNFPLRGDSWSPTDLNNLFSLAREYHLKSGRLVLLHFEELSALCENRNASERAGVQAALLSNLEGSSGKPRGVFVTACTNSLKSIPSPLIRPGRLKVIEFCMDRRGREEVLKHYLRKEGIRESRLARSLPPSLTPASIEQMVKDAAALARQEGREPTLRDLVHSMYPFILGPPDQSWDSEEERWITCIHEAGHATVGRALGAEVKLTAVPLKGYRKGITVLDWGSQRYFIDTQEKVICNLLAGKEAERMFGVESWDEPTDVAQATTLSLEKFSEHEPDTNYMDEKLLFEMDEINPGSVPLRVPEDERSRIYKRARMLRKRCRERVQQILEKVGRRKIEQLARAIEVREFLLRDELQRFLD